MVGKLIKEVYEYKDVVLVSEAKVTANEVTTEDGKVTTIPNGSVSIEIDGMENSFGFSIYSNRMGGKKSYSTNGVPEGVSAETIVKEFVDFVEKDIA